MDIQSPLELLGGISPMEFSKKHWQKKPLLIRQAIPGFTPILGRPALFGLAARDDVESRLISREGPGGAGWRMARGPFPRRRLPALNQPNWTLLVQGVDLHVQAAHELLGRFRFMPDARLDDLMISFATDGGGVGAHIDRYDVFLLQAQGRRRWRIGRQKDLSLKKGVPLKLLKRFVPEQEFVLEPGDMLYLPPEYAHEGVAIGACMTYSIGFRSPSVEELCRGVLAGLAEHMPDATSPRHYTDPSPAATVSPAALPAALRVFAREALANALAEQTAIDRSLGEFLTEPKQDVWFDAPVDEQLTQRTGGLCLDRRTRMLYDERHVFINGESFQASGQDFRLMQRLADVRRLTERERLRLSAGARDTLSEWIDAGWVSVEGRS